MSKILFQPVRTTEERIKDIPCRDGYVYFTSDSGKIYMDTATERVGLGSAGVAIYYGNVELKHDETVIYYTLPKDKVDGSAKINDLIFNSDGSFYKVYEIEADSYTCTLLAVSGGMDSMCLLDLFSQVLPMSDFAIAHCNFSLRGEESDGDQVLVEARAKELGVQVFVKRFDTKNIFALLISVCHSERRAKPVVELLRVERSERAEARDL